MDPINIKPLIWSINNTDVEQAIIEAAHSDSSGSSDTLEESELRR